MDALALGVARGGVGLADEVLLRVAGHLRRRPAPHREPRDVPPVPTPVLLQPVKEQPAHTHTQSNKEEESSRLLLGRWQVGPTRQLGPRRSSLASPLE